MVSGNKSSDSIDLKGAPLSLAEGARGALLSFLRETLDNGLLDALLIPMKVPAGDSYAWVLVKDKSLLEDANPFAPIMPVQGARALSSITKHGAPDLRIGAVLRPCEQRAAIELCKLKQLDMEKVVFITLDCPGVIPLKDWFSDPEKGETQFQQLLEKGDFLSPQMRPVCQICDKMSAPIDVDNATFPDIHFALLGVPENKGLLIPFSDIGNELLEKTGQALSSDTQTWQSKVKEINAQKCGKRKTAHEKLDKEISGPEKFPKAFAFCINCHNCMRVCPVCYCQKCYFDSEMLKHSADTYLERSMKKGSLWFKPDSLLFQIGRLSHMSLSCVSCGTCQDACPMDIIVGQVFAFSSDQTQQAFEYAAGRNLDETLPMRIYQEDKELPEVCSMCKDVLESGEDQ
ncbi:hypothetical protein JW877_01560 [bacterium]|nr:hypothetical protein [bacterium]